MTQTLSEGQTIRIRKEAAYMDRRPLFFWQNRTVWSADFYLNAALPYFTPSFFFMFLERASLWMRMVMVL